jgi:hypothetical protein
MDFVVVSLNNRNALCDVRSSRILVLSNRTTRPVNICMTSCRVRLTLTFLFLHRPHPFLDFVCGRLDPGILFNMVED